jgi:hypothetical protein
LRKLIFIGEQGKVSIMGESEMQIIEAQKEEM